MLFTCIHKSQKKTDGFEFNLNRDSKLINDHESRSKSVTILLNHNYILAHLALSWASHTVAARFLFNPLISFFFSFNIYSIFRDNFWLLPPARKLIRALPPLIGAN